MHKNTLNTLKILTLTTLNRIKRTYSLWLISLVFLFGCNEPTVINENPPLEAVSDTVSVQKDNVSLDKNEETNTSKEPTIQRYSYPNMSLCGGGLDGIYKNGELIRIESTYGGELGGYVTKDVDFQKGKIIKITSRERIPEWEKYNKKHPNASEIDERKMTYTDTLYIIEFGKAKSFKKYAGKKLISTIFDKELTDKLLECTEVMKKELATEKMLNK